MAFPDDPLTGPPPAEVPLPDAPLVHVLAQVRFPRILMIGTDSAFIAPFQESIRDGYPHLRQEQTREVRLDGGGDPVPGEPRRAWRFLDANERWRVSLTPDFLSLETTAYGSRTDFFGRLRGLVEALGEHVRPGSVERLGIRYVNRVRGETAGRIRELVRPEVAGVLGTSVAARLTHALTECAFEPEEESTTLLARWGALPPGATVDASVMDPVDDPSWILDLDMFSNGTLAFDADVVMDEAERYFRRLYTVFRWAVTDDFLRHHGGDPS